PYDGVATVSSSGNCTVRPYACTATVLSTQGTFYPFWALHGRAGAAFWTYGAHYPTEVRSFPTDAGPSNGTVATFAPAIALGPVGALVSASTFNVTLRISDPAGVAMVAIATDYCVGSSPASPTRVAAVLGAGPANTRFDGNWTAQFALGSFKGTFPIWVQVSSSASAFVAGTDGSLTLSTGASGCTLLPPAAPIPALPLATPTAEGYIVQWSDADPAVVGFTVNATAPNGSEQRFDVGAVNETRIDLGASNVSFNVSVAARYGGNLSSPFTVPALAPPTLDAFSLSVVVSTALPLWLGGLPLNVSGTVAGGAGLYQVDLSFGDGGTAIVVTNGTFASVHGYGLFFGEAWVEVHASDAAGDSASSPPILVPVWATPIGSASSAIGGDSLVEIQWQVPASPSGPVLGARVFYTTDATLASALTWAGGSNASVPGIQVWNLTGNLLFVPVANGQTLYAQVLARNSFGLGQLPNGAPSRLVAQPALLVLSPITSVGGGRAPFSDNFSAQLTGGSNDSIASAFYAFPSGGTSSATIAYLNGTSYLNASHTFPSPGTFVVVLHATDALFETLIDTTTVFVAAGASPGFSALVVNGPAYAGGSVDFEATANGGSGNYSFNWSFGDGTTSNGTNAVHTYVVSGAYSVLVTVVDEVTGGASAIVVPVVVFSLPVIFLSVTSGPNGSLSYDLRASVGGGSGPSSVVWSFGDGTIGRGSLVSHDFREAGTYSVNVTATDPAGRSGTASFNLTASASPGSTGPGGGSSGFTLLDLVLVGVAAFLLATTLYFGARARPPAEPDAVEEPDEDEDGEVSLT
ncbi:MAG TPA: PKD domain-containing protein, partial [Thermoplasmata archaeon]